VDVSIEGNVLLLRLADGDDLVEAIKQAIRKAGVDSAVIIGGVGMIKGAALSFYVGSGEYDTVPLDGEAEICSLSGNVSKMDGQHIVHCHAVLGVKGGSAVGGHLSGGRIYMTGEIAMLATPQRLRRRLDPNSGLKLLGFE
jgi:hypothetical protein